MFFPIGYPNQNNDGNYNLTDFTSGGTWQFIMNGPDGVDYPNTNVFVEVVKPERIVIKHAMFPHFLATAIFEDLDGKTKLTYSTVFYEAGLLLLRHTCQMLLKTIHGLFGTWDGICFHLSEYSSILSKF
jgi:uncharacterized protein YndB with AHSA1/START domain